MSEDGVGPAPIVNGPAAAELAGRLPVTLRSTVGDVDPVLIVKLLATKLSPTVTSATATFAANRFQRYCTQSVQTLMLEPKSEVKLSVHVSSVNS